LKPISRLTCKKQADHITRLAARVQRGDHHYFARERFAPFVLIGVLLREISEMVRRRTESICRPALPAINKPRARCPFAVSCEDKTISERLQPYIRWQELCERKRVAGCLMLKQGIHVNNISTGPECANKSGAPLCSLRLVICCGPRASKEERIGAASHSLKHASTGEVEGRKGWLLLVLASHPPHACASTHHVYVCTNVYLVCGCGCAHSQQTACARVSACKGRNRAPPLVRRPFVCPWCQQINDKSVSRNSHFL
jgi:hypothetical protein